MIICKPSQSANGDKEERLPKIPGSDPFLKGHWLRVCFAGIRHVVLLFNFLNDI